jgi:hypothetical protein
MARKTKLIAIHEEGDNRDNGKVFVITELPATEGFWLAVRFMRYAIKALGMPEDVATMGMAGIAAIGLRGILHAFADIPEAELKDILREMRTCVQIAPDARNPQVQRPLIDDDTEEWSTLTRLYTAWIELHTGFSLTDAPSISAQATSGQAA